MHLNTLKKEIFKSDILRVKILMAFFIFLALYVNIWSFFNTRDSEFLIKNNISHWIPFTLILLIACYFILQLMFFLHYQKKGKFISSGFKFFTLFIEISLPSLFLFIFFQYNPPMYILFSARTAVYYFFIILSALTLDFRMSVFAGTIAGLEYAILGFYILHSHKFSGLNLYNLDVEHIISRSLIFFLIGAVTAFVTQQIKNNLFSAFKATEEREQIAYIFGRHVSPEVVNMLLNRKRDQLSTSQFVCVLFLDIRKFTSYAENRNPEEVVNYLNHLFSIAIEIINKHHGIINKFLGDGFMAVFGAPFKGEHDIDDAVDAAEAILAEVDKKIAQGTIPNTRLGIGIHCGLAVTGNIGDELRQEYTIIGDVVNLASRIEQLNKVYNSQLIISEDVHALLQKPRGELLGDIPVPGRQKTIRVYQLK